MNFLYTSSAQSSSLFSWMKKTGWAHSAAKWATTRHTSYFRHVDAMIFIWWCGSWGKLSRITIRVDHSAPEPGYNGATPPSNSSAPSDVKLEPCTFFLLAQLFYFLSLLLSSPVDGVWLLSVSGSDGTCHVSLTSCNFRKSPSFVWVPDWKSCIQNCFCLLLMWC